MPMYEYKCPTCTQVFDVLAKMGQAPESPDCPACDDVGARVFGRRSRHPHQLIRLLLRRLRHGRHGHARHGHGPRTRPRPQPRPRRLRHGRFRNGRLLADIQPPLLPSSPQQGEVPLIPPPPPLRGRCRRRRGYRPTPTQPPSYPRVPRVSRRRYHRDHTQCSTSSESKARQSPPKHRQPPLRPRPRSRSEPPPSAASSHFRWLLS